MPKVRKMGSIIMNQSPPPKSPPNWAIRFLEWFCPDELVEGILGDLLEEYEYNSQVQNSGKANLVFIWSVLRFFHPSIILRNHRTVNFINMGILKNYVKVAFRSFGRQKLTTSINIFGLTLGIACAGLAYLFRQQELSYDKFHHQSETIYTFMTKFRGDINFISTPGPLAPTLVAELPEVTEGIRLQGKKVLVEADQEVFNEQVLLTDAHFFEFFDFDLLMGDKKKVLIDLKSLVISKEKALKYFGSRDPIGETIQLNMEDKLMDFVISGVAANPPVNSSIQFGFLVPIQAAFQQEKEKLASDWEGFPVKSFIRLKDKVDYASFVTKLPAFASSKYPKSEDAGEAKMTSNYQFLPQPLDDFHFNGFSDVGIAAGGKMINVKRLSWIGILILLVACFNFINLSNAKSSQRLKEVGVRKVLGARKMQLKKQFIVEAILISLVAFVLAILLMDFSMPYIENLTDYSLMIEWFNPSVLLPIAGIALLAGLLAGLYPSFLLSNLKVVDTFKSTFKVGGNNWATKGSLIIQFAVGVGLLSCTFIMYQQQAFIHNKNLGYNTEEVVVVPFQISYGEKEKGNQLLRQYKQELNQMVDIEKVSGVSWSFTKGNAVSFIKDESGKTEWLTFYRVEPTFIPMMEMELVAGRNFRQEEEGAENKGVIVNETFVKKYEVEKPIGYKLPKKFQDYADATIIGVVKDFNFENLRKSIKPVLLTTEKGYIGNALVKIKRENTKNTIAKLEESWQKINSNTPFKFSFLDEDVQRQYAAEARWNKVFTGATIFIIVIACLGLFGLIALTLAERTKEIGVRKILGASIMDITWMVARQFILMLLIASIIAIPIVIYGMNDWLSNFAYQIDIQWFIFFIAIMGTALLALFTTAIQTIKAALKNPVDALRTD